MFRKRKPNKYRFGTLGYFMEEFRRFFQPTKYQNQDMKNNIDLPLVVIDDDTKEEYRINGFGITYDTEPAPNYITATGKKLNFHICITKRKI